MLNKENSGKRIELVSTNDPHTRLRPGSQGTILWEREGWEGEKSISVQWDDGSSLSLIPAEGDQFRILD